MSQYDIENTPPKGVSNWLWRGAVAVVLIGGTAFVLNQDVAPPVPSSHPDIIALQTIAEGMLTSAEQGEDPFDGVVIPDGTLNGILLPQDNSVEDTDPLPDALVTQHDNRDGTKTTIEASITDDNGNTTATLVIDRRVILDQNPDDAFPEQQTRKIQISVDPAGQVQKIYKEDSYLVSMRTTADAPCGIPDSQDLAPLFYSGVLAYSLGAAPIPTHQEPIPDHSNMSMQARLERILQRTVGSNPPSTNTGVRRSYPLHEGQLVLQRSESKIFHPADNQYQDYEYLGLGPLSIAQPQQILRYSRLAFSPIESTAAQCRFVDRQNESPPPEWKLYQRILSALASFWS
ncbi:MAG: hypothetical protein ACOCXT_06860 [Candidatus Dojkabacteria bacterium]